MGAKSKYPSLEKRLEAEAAAKAKKEEKAARAVQAKEDKAVRDARDGEGLGAALQRVMAKQEMIAESREDHMAAVAEYLKPYLRKLNALERSMRAFPSNVQIPWAEIESEILDPTSPENIREVGDRYGVERKALYDMSRKRKWTARRAVVMELHSRTSTVKAMASNTHALVGGTGNPGESIADDEELIVGLVKECLNQINVSLASGLIPFRSAGDVDKIVRLLLVVQGRADSIKETRNALTHADMERITSKVAKNLKVNAALAGIIIPVKEAEFEVHDDAEWDESAPKVTEKPAAPSV